MSFEFIKKPGESSYARPWLQAEPSSGFIMPGECHDSKINEKQENLSAAVNNIIEVLH